MRSLLLALVLATLGCGGSDAGPDPLTAWKMTCAVYHAPAETGRGVFCALDDAGSKEVASEAATRCQGIEGVPCACTAEWSGEACASYGVLSWEMSATCEDRGLTDCGYGCVDVQNDPYNCGRCGNECPLGCASGVCQ